MSVAEMVEIWFVFSYFGKVPDLPDRRMYLKCILRYTDQAVLFLHSLRPLLWIISLADA